MLDKKLNWLTRTGFALLALVGLLFSNLFGEYVFKTYGSSEIRSFVYLIAFPGLFVSLALTALMIWVAISGKFNVGIRSNIPYLSTVLGIFLGFFIITMCLFTYIAPLTRENPADWRSIFGTQLIFILFFFLIIAALCVVLKKVYSFELKTREKLLEIEYRIADIAEKLEKTKTNE